MHANLKDLETIKKGDTVTIRRSSGAEQTARVLNVRSGLAYVAPEVVSFEVYFVDKATGKECTKGCNAFDLIRKGI